MPSFLSQFFRPLLGRTRSRNKCWAAIRLSHRAESWGKCSPWGGRWIGHWRTTWSTVRSSAPHSQAAERQIPRL